MGNKLLLLLLDPWPVVQRLDDALHYQEQLPVNMENSMFRFVEQKIILIWNTGDTPHRVSIWCMIYMYCCGDILLEQYIMMMHLSFYNNYEWLSGLAPNTRAGCSKGASITSRIQVNK